MRLAQVFLCDSDADAVAAVKRGAHSAISPNFWRRQLLGGRNVSSSYFQPGKARYLNTRKSFADNIKVRTNSHFDATCACMVQLASLTTIVLTSKQESMAAAEAEMRGLRSTLRTLEAALRNIVSSSPTCMRGAGLHCGSTAPLYFLYSCVQQSERRKVKNIISGKLRDKATLKKQQKQLQSELQQATEALAANPDQTKLDDLRAQIRSSENDIEEMRTEAKEVCALFIVPFASVVTADILTPLFV